MSRPLGTRMNGAPTPIISFATAQYFTWCLIG